MTRKYRLIFLGAGFSVPAQLPLASDLWRQITDAVKVYGKDTRAHKFFNDLDSYITFKRDTEGVSLTPDAVDFEDFMRFLDIEHYLGLRGGDTWSEDGNEATVVVKHLIGKILARQMINLKTVPDLYIEFAKRLQPGDTVFTFNYDTLLERALEAVDKPYRLVPSRYKTVDEFGGTIDSDVEEVSILKVHGSIDWFDRAPFDRAKTIWARNGNPNEPDDVIFSRSATLGLEPIVGSPYPDSDPLKTVYRARNLAKLHETDLLFRATPRLLAPSATKLLYASRLSDFWAGWGRGGGRFNYGMSVVGFSLPLHDDYARQILHSLVKTYQHFDNGKPDDLGHRRSPLVIVNYFKNSEAETEFKERYRFVDWSKTKLFGSGFGNDCLDAIFA